MKLVSACGSFPRIAPDPSAPTTSSVSSGLLVAAVLLVATFLLPAPLEGRQSGEGEVVAVVQELFDAMRARDSARAAAVLLPEGQLVVQRPAPDGTMTIQVMPHRDFLASLARAEEVWNERFWDPDVFVEGDFATLRTAYDFHRGAEFSHCGVEVFNLLRISGAWVIVGGAYTVQPTGCTPSPLGPP